MTWFQKWGALSAKDAVDAVLTMRMLCFLRRCFVSRRNRLLTCLSGMLLYIGTPLLQMHTSPVGSLKCQV